MVTHWLVSYALFFTGFAVSIIADTAGLFLTFFFFSFEDAKGTKAHILLKILSQALATDIWQCKSVCVFPHLVTPGVKIFQSQKYFTTQMLQ